MDMIYFKNEITKILLISVILILITQKQFSQHSGFNFDFGISKTGNYFKPGESLGVGYFKDFELSKNFQIRFEGSLAYKSIINKGKSFHGRTDNYYAEYKYKEVPRLLYFNLPVQSIYNYKKIHLGIGYEFSIFLTNLYNRKLSHYIYYKDGRVDETVFSESMIVENIIIINPWIFSNEKYRLLNHGFIMSLGYPISQNWDIMINYYSSLTNIILENFRYPDLKFQSGSISIKRYLRTKQ